MWRRLAVVLFLLGLLRVLASEGAAQGQSWRTPTRTPTRRPTIAVSTPTPAPPIATATPRSTPCPTGTPVTIGDASGYAGITLAACAVAFPHAAFDPRTVKISVRWSEVGAWQDVRQPWEGSCYVFSDGRPLAMGQGQVQIRWQDGPRFDTRWGGVVIGPLPNPTVTPRPNGNSVFARWK